MRKRIEKITPPTLRKSLPSRVTVTKFAIIYAHIEYTEILDYNANMVKVRFAPSPTGIPHVGNIRTALFDYFFAKHEKGSFILRLEDTDQARKQEGAVKAIKDSLEWLGCNWDEFVVQSERLDEYTRYADELVAKGHAKVEDGAVRFVVDKSIGKISWIDAVGNKRIEYDTNDIEDFIILKKDGFPTYHLANVVDDHLMGITHVIRGEDWIPSAPKHVLLYNSFGWEIPVFAHVPNVMGVDGKKLSKRRGAKSVLDFEKEGFLPEALLNYLMLLGWSPKNDKEILSKDELITEFSLDKINSAPSIFDERKLLWMNGEYLRSMTNEEILNALLEFDNGLGEIKSEYLLQLVGVAKTRMKTLSEFRLLIAPFVDENFKTPPSEIKELFRNFIEGLKEMKKDDIVDEIKRLNKENGYSFQDIYNALIGRKSGLPLADAFMIIGRDKTLALLK